MAAVIAVSVLLVMAVGCAKKKQQTSIGYQSAEAQYRQGMEQLAQRKLTQARSSFQRVQYSAEDRKELEPLVRLALADATFYQGHDFGLIDARSLYLDFVTLFADHPMAPYAQFQTGMCSLGQVANPSKDQTQTLQAITELKEVQRRFPDSHYATAARLMLRAAESNLAEHEFLVGRFYMKKKAWLAAADRFRKALDHYPHYGEKDKLYLHLGQTLMKTGNDTEARIYLDKLVTDYPQGRYREDARKALVEAGGALELGIPESP